VRTFSRTSQFKKDVKLAGRRGKDLAKLKAAIDLLIDGEVLPPQHRDHPLRRNFAGSRDCHIEPAAKECLDLRGNPGRLLP
jgi:mRNA interferase YafQ